jgi:ProP effector
MSHKINTAEYEAIAALWARLMAAYPKAFAAPPVPLKVGIARDILSAHPDIEPRLLAHVLRRWCGRPSYFKALMRAPERVDLAGEPAGEVSAEHKVHAAERLKAAKEKARKTAVTTVTAVQNRRSAPTPGQDTPEPPRSPARPVLRLPRGAAPELGEEAGR